MKVPVYDILDCGPRHRFVASGKLVHNSMGGSKINVANMPRPMNPTKLDEGMIVKMGTEFPAILRINNTGSKFMIDGSSEMFFSKKYMLAGLRDCIMAPKCELLVVSDSSQIEARILAWIAQEEYLLELFRKFNADPNGKEDTYTTLASDIYGVHVTTDDHDKDKRFVGKEARLGLGYQMGWPKFQRSVRVKAKVILDDEFSKNVVNVYRAVNPMTVALWKRCNAALQQMIDGETVDLGRPGMAIAMPASDHDPMPRIQLPNGMCLRYPGLDVERGDRGRKYTYMQAKGKNQVKSNIYGGKITEGICQASARIVVTDQWLRIKKRAIKEGISARSPIVGHTYDELIVSVKKEMAEDMKAIMVEEMSKSPTFMPGIPVACKADIAERYGDAK